MRDQPEGHIVVSKQEQNALLQSKESLQPISKSIEERKSIEKQQSQEEVDDNDSHISNIPSPTMQNHQIEVENLKWQIEYEKKLHQEMGQLLEDKVSHLMA